MNVSNSILSFNSNSSAIANNAAKMASGSGDIAKEVSQNASLNVNLDASIGTLKAANEISKRVLDILV